MKKECDANGLEYELLMQESTKDRFLREVTGNTFDLNKHLVVVKQKRQSPEVVTEPEVAAVAEEVSKLDDAVVAAPEPAVAIDEEKVAAPIVAPLAAGAGLIRHNLLTDLNLSRLFINVRERLAARRIISPIAPIVPIVPPIMPAVVVPPIAPLAGGLGGGLGGLSRLGGLGGLGGLSRLTSGLSGGLLRSSPVVVQPSSSDE